MSLDLSPSQHPRQNITPTKYAPPKYSPLTYHPNTQYTSLVPRVSKCKFKLFQLTHKSLNQSATPSMNSFYINLVIPSVPQLFHDTCHRPGPNLMALLIAKSCACNHHSLLTVQVPKFCASFVSEERKNSLLKYAWKKCGIPNLSKHKFFACGKQTNKIGPCFDHDDTATASHSDPSRICLEGSIKGLVTLQRKLVGCKLPLVIRP